MGYMDDFYKNVEQVGVVPVVVLDRVEDAVPLGKALAEGGLPAAEVTFRTAAAADSIHAIAQECPDVLVGAGTVLDEAQAKRAVDAGARYIVSPGYDMGVVRWCLAHEVPVIPAGVTPTEVTALVNEGIEVTKFFPAAQYGGLATIRALAVGLCGAPLHAHGRRECREPQGLPCRPGHHCLRGHLDVQAGDDSRGRVRPHLRALARGGCNSSWVGQCQGHAW